MTTAPAEDPIIDHSLLTKADALIRRNRPDGVGSEAEELPLLTDRVDDDLPELTDTLLTLSTLDAQQASNATPERVEQAFSLSLNLEDEDIPSAYLHPPVLNKHLLEEAVGAATQQLREEMHKAHEQALHEAVAKARAESQAEATAQLQKAVQAAFSQGREETRASQREAHERTLHEVIAKTRAETLAEARQMQHHAVQAALAQGREEAEINQWPAIQEARREAVQEVASAMSERLIELDAQIAQSLNQWLAKELPSLIATELRGVAERLRVQTAAHMRATLLPELSEQVSKVLESALKDDSQQA